MMAMKQKQPGAIDVHIEELMLHGFAPGDRYRVGEAVQCELARLLGEQGLSPVLTQSHEIVNLNGGTFNVTSNNPDKVGAQIARALHGSLSQ